MTNYDILKEYEAHKTPISSYEEWQELNKDVNTMTELWRNAENQLSEKIQLIGKLGVQAGRMREENQQLKELFKECKEFFYENLIDTEFHFSCGLGSDIKKQSCIKSLSKLKTKIDEVLK